MPRSHRLTLALLACLPLAAHAADVPDVPDDAGGFSDTRHAEPVDLDGVKVVSSPLHRSAEEMTHPAEMLSGSRLDAAKAATLGETVGRLTGVQSSFFGAGVGRPVVRGLDGPRVAVLSGGLGTQDVSTVSQDHGTSVEPFLADRIEVLKGPATLLYGSGAIGGVVNVMDGRIAESALDETVAGRAELRYDSVSHGRTAMGRVDASGANGALVLHADALHRDQDDYDTPLGVQRNSDVHTGTAALGASWVTDTGFAGVAASRYENRYGNPGEPGDAATGEPAVQLDMKQDRFEAKAGLDRAFGPFGGLRARIAHTGYEHVELEGTEVGTRFLNDATEARVELTHRAFGAWEGAFGLQGVERDFRAVGEEAFIPHTRTRATGVFVTEQARWDALQLDLGARIDHVRSATDTGASERFAPLSLSAGALWKASDAWRVTLNVDRAERAPGEEELFANGAHVATDSFEIGRPDLREERALQTELGMHYHGGRIEAKAAIYRTAFDGFIYLADTGALEDGLPVRQWTQADARFNGMEGEITAKLVDRDSGTLALRVFGDRVRARLDDGANLPRIAPARVGANLDWTADGWRASLGATRYARQDDVAPGETPTAGYTLVDAHFAWHIDRGENAMELFVDGSNLTDAEARVHTSFLKDRVVLPGRGLAAGIRMFF